MDLQRLQLAALIYLGLTFTPNPPRLHQRLGSNYSSARGSGSHITPPYQCSGNACLPSDSGRPTTMPRNPNTQRRLMRLTLAERHQSLFEQLSPFSYHTNPFTHQFSTFEKKRKNSVASTRRVNPTSSAVYRVVREGFLNTPVDACYHRHMAKSPSSLQPIHTPKATRDSRPKLHYREACLIERAKWGMRESCVYLSPRYFLWGGCFDGWMHRPTFHLKDTLDSRICRTQ